MDVRIVHALSVLAASGGRDISFDQIARQVNLSPSRFRHLFRVEVGSAPGTYLKQLRLQQAKHLFGTTFLQVKEVRNAIGFADASHFSRDYKRLFGTSPSTERGRKSFARAPRK